MKSVIALYENWETADAVVEALLDYGFAHSDVTLMSGDHWTRLSRAHLPAGTESGKLVLLRLRAEGLLEHIMRDLVCNSGAIDVRDLLGEEEAEEAIAPVAAVLPHPANL